MVFGSISASLNVSGSSVFVCLVNVYKQLVTHSFSGGRYSASAAATRNAGCEEGACNLDCAMVGGCNSDKKKEILC
jgi:hypothetical protein